MVMDTLSVEGLDVVVGEIVVEVLTGLVADGSKIFKGENDI